MYLLFITLLFCLAYVILYFVFPLFFTKTTKPLTLRSIPSLIKLFAYEFIVFLIHASIPGVEFRNRFLHAFGGGFAAFFLCYLIVKDTNLKLTRFQFFIICMLVVVALGVANEILEFFLQNYSGLHLIFAPTINDTWLDLISNTVGALVAASIFTPLIKKQNA